MARIFRNLFPLAVIAVMFPFLLGADWPAYKSGSARTSFATESLTPPLEQKWSTAGPVNPSPSVRYSSPVVAGNKVYFATNTGVIQAYSLSGSGSANPVLWSFKTDGPIYGSPAWAVVGLQERVFVGSTDGYLYCLDAGNGTFIWKRNLGSAIFSSPIVFTLNGAQIVLIGSNDGNVYALKVGDGSAYWTKPFSTNGYVFASPVFDPATNRVFVPSYDGNLYAIDTASGTQAWVQNVGPTRSTPAVVGNRIVMISNAGFIRSFDTSSGTVLGGNGVGQIWGSASSPAVVPGSPSTMIFSFDNGNVWAFRTQTSSTSLASAWLRTLPDKVYSTPAISNGVVYVGCDNGNLYALNLLNGNILQTITLGATVQVAPAVGQGTLLIASGTGQLRAYGMSLAGYKWLGPANPSLGSPTSYAIQAIDSNGNAVPSYTGTANLSVVTGTGVVLGVPSVQFAGGNASVTLTFNQTGSATVRAISTATPTMRGDLTVTVSATGPRLQVSLTNDKTTAHENDLIHYNAIISNTGASNASAVRLTLPVPLSATYLSSGLPPSATTGDQVLWDLGDFAPGTGRNIQFTLRADPATIFASDFNVGEISDAWATTSPKFYVIDQARVLVTSPNIGGEEAWLHTVDNLYRRRLTIDGSVQYLGGNQSDIKLTRNGTTGGNDYVRLQTDLGSGTFALNVLGTNRQSAPLVSPGTYLYHIEIDFVTHRLFVRFRDTNPSNPNPTLLEYTSTAPEDTPDTNSLYFGVFNNNGALLLNDDIRITDTGRQSLNSVDVNVTAATTVAPIVAATSNVVSTGILGVPKLTILKTVLPSMTNPRLAVTANQGLTYRINYGNQGTVVASNVTVWDTIPTNLFLENVGVPSGVTGVTPPAGSAPGFMGWNVGNLAPGTSGTVTLQTRVKDLSLLPDNEVFVDNFDYADPTALYNLWQTTTPSNFVSDGQSNLVATAINAESDFITLKQAVPCGDEMARVTAKLRWLNTGAAQFLVSATPLGTNILDSAVGAGPLVSVFSDSNNLYVKVYDNTTGEKNYGPVGNFTPGVDYYLEVIYNRVGREASVNLIDSRTDASAFFTGAFIANNLGTYPDILVGFRAFNTSLAVGNVHISREDIDQSASTTGTDFTRKFTSIPHLFAWVEKPVLTLTIFGPTQANIGDSLQYTIEVDGHGSVNPQGIKVVDVLPAGLNFVSSVPSPVSVNGSVVTWNIPLMLAYGERNIQLNVTAASAGQAVQNVTESANNAPKVLQSSWTTTINAPAGLNPLVRVSAPSLATEQPTATETLTFTPTITFTPTFTSSFVWVGTLTRTPTPTVTDTATYTATSSPTVTQTPSPSNTWTFSPTPSETPTSTATNIPVRNCGGSLYRLSGAGTSMFFDSGNAVPPVDPQGRDWKSVGYQKSSAWGSAVVVTSPPTSWISPCGLNGQQGAWIAVTASGLPPTLADAYFRDVFSLHAGSSATQATLVLSGDNIVEAWLNGTTLGRFEGPYGNDSQLYTRCVTVTLDPSLIQTTNNVLAFHLINQNTKHGLVYSMSLDYRQDCTPVTTATCTATWTPVNTSTSTPTSSPTKSFTPTPPIPTTTPTFTPTVGLSRASLNPIAYPNPSRGEPVHFNVTGGPYDMVSLRLVTLSGRTIWRMNHPVLSASDETFVWNLADSENTPVSNGLYLAIFELHQGSDVIHKSIKVMVLR